MIPNLNFSKRGPKFQLLGKIYKLMDNKKTLEILSRNGITNRFKALIYIKIILMNMFFDYELSKLINEINKCIHRLKKIY